MQFLVHRSTGITLKGFLPLSIRQERDYSAWKASCSECFHGEKDLWQSARLRGLAYRCSEVELLHDAVVRVFLLGMVALIEDQQVDLLNLHMKVFTSGHSSQSCS